MKLSNVQQKEHRFWLIPFVHLSMEELNRKWSLRNGPRSHDPSIKGILSGTKRVSLKMKPRLCGTNADKVNRQHLQYARPLAAIAFSLSSSTERSSRPYCSGLSCVRDGPGFIVQTLVCSDEKKRSEEKKVLSRASGRRIVREKGSESVNMNSKLQ